MCGIIGYIGNRNAYKILIEGLKKLEYRGYDSVGISINNNKVYNTIKTTGKVNDLEKKIKNITYVPNIGIGHTRWATHGEPNDINAHPHTSNSGNIIMIHNGIVENYNVLKNILINNNFFFKTETDTEILVNYIEYIKTNKNVSLYEAVRITLNVTIGSYSIAILENNNINEIIIAKLGSPIVIGIGENKEFFISSDIYSFIKYTKNVLYLKDGEIATINRDKNINIYNIISNNKINNIIQKINIKSEEVEKGKYRYFMIKEINEQPNSIFNIIRRRLSLDKKEIFISGMSDNYIQKFSNSNRIIIIACGTSLHAGLIGEYLFEEITRIPVKVEYASEFRYKNPILSSKDIIIAISQSGETADTLAAIKLSKEMGAFIFSICNVVSSSISRISDSGAYTYAGHEIGVASTKTFTSQVAILILMALKIGNYKGLIKKQYYNYLCKELYDIHKKIFYVLNKYDIIKNISKIYYNYKSFLYLGRGYSFPVALEGALKLKEISYIHAEGYPAAEMKHGPIALIDDNMPVVVIVTKKHYKKLINNIQEIKARKGKIIAIINNNNINDDIKDLVDHIIEVPETPEELSPLVTTIPLQLLAYYIAIIRGKNVDQPRNLAKSVTVE